MALPRSTTTVIRRQPTRSMRCRGVAAGTGIGKLSSSFIMDFTSGLDKQMMTSTAFGENSTITFSPHRAFGLETAGMAHGAAIDLARLWLPARTAFAIPTTASRIEAETTNDHEGVSIADIDRDPTALSLFPVVEESVGSELAPEKARFTENVTGGTAAIVA